VLSKRRVRESIRFLTRCIPIRGRHRLVRAISTRLGSDTEVIDFGSLRVAIEHGIETTRHVYYGVYEEHLVNWIAGNLRPGDRVIEPGMNIGFIASQILNAIGPSGLLVSLEPSRRCCASLRSINDLDRLSNFVLLNAALAGSEGTETFYESDRIVSRGFGCLKSAGQPADAIQYHVDVRTVDGLMRTHGIDRLRFLKLDIEGSEVPALEGASGALAAGAIDYVMVETEIDASVAAQCEVNHRLVGILRGAGFVPYRMLRSGALRPFDMDGALKHTKRIRTDLMWALAK
jgi:FkbM family methyltransferase